MLIWMLFSWWLIGFVFLVGLTYADWRNGSDISLGEVFLCFLWAFCGPIMPAIMLYLVLRNKGMINEIKRFFERPVVKGKKQ
jgi:hypothetical protein